MIRVVIYITLVLQALTVLRTRKKQRYTSLQVLWMYMGTLEQGQQQGRYFSFFFSFLCTENWLQLSELQKVALGAGGTSEKRNRHIAQRFESKQCAVANRFR